MARCATMLSQGGEAFTKTQEFFDKFKAGLRTHNSSVECGHHILP